MAGEAELLSAEEVAQYLGVRVITVYEWCRRGRLPCLKIGKVWRIRRTALEAFLERSERQATLVGQLRAFLTVPDYVLAVAETAELLYRLDAAFFQVGEARDGLLVKFYGGEDSPLEVLRSNLARYGLDVERLEAEGRLRLSPEVTPLSGRAETLRQLIEAEAASGRTIWASFNWKKDVGLEMVLQEQAAMAAIVASGQLVVKTAVLETITDDWPPVDRRRIRHLYGALIEVSEAGLTLSRRTPLPPT